MIGVQELRTGVAFVMEGQPYVVLKYEHIKMGRGSATIRVKIRNLVTGTVIEKSFINSARVEETALTRKPMQYLYKDGESYVFMDPKTYEQVNIGEIEEGKYLKGGVTVNVLFWEERALAVELPPKMNFTVVETDPGVRGDSVANIYKLARLDNGMAVRVPLFVREGERIAVDTRDGSYVERVKN